MSDWKSILRAIAPTIATGIGGPFAGMATKFLSQGLLGKADGTESELASAFRDPNKLAMLKGLENEFELELQRIGIEKDKLVAADRDSARTMAANTSIIPQAILSGMLLVGFFGVIALIFSGMEGLDDQAKMIISGLCGSLATYVGIAIKFWLGGSMHDETTMNNIYNAIPAEKVKRK